LARVAGVCLAGAVAAGVVCVDGAAAQPPSFPTAFDREALLAWLQRETDIAPDRVVAVTPQVVTAVVSSFPAVGGQGPRVVIRAEALNGETHARTGALSWHVSMSADCAAHRVRMGETTGYSARNLLGERRILRPAETDWRVPEAGTALDNAWKVACDAGFTGPFQDPSARNAHAGAPATQVQAPPAAATPPAPAPKPLGRTFTRGSAAVPPAAPAPAPPARPQPAPRGGPAVQIGSFPDNASATAALAALGDGRVHGLEVAVVGGRTWYRAIVSGFASTSEAAKYCAQRQAAGGTCFVRGAPRG
jgi:hypothetical protein